MTRNRLEGTLPPLRWFQSPWLLCVICRSGAKLRHRERGTPRATARISTSVSLVTVAVSSGCHIKIPDEHVVRQEHDAERNLFLNQTGAHNGYVFWTNFQRPQSSLVGARG